MLTDLIDSGPDSRASVDPKDDPATPELRIKLTRKLLISAINRYEETLAACNFMDEAYPTLIHPVPAADDAVKAERLAWRRLIDNVGDDFDNAELALASRIQNLYGEFAHEGNNNRIELSLHGPFYERAIRYRGTIYALQYDVRDYSPGTNIIAIVRDGRLFDLAEVAGDDPPQPVNFP